MHEFGVVFMNFNHRTQVGVIAYENPADGTTHHLKGRLVKVGRSNMQVSPSDYITIAALAKYCRVVLKVNVAENLDSILSVLEDSHKLDRRGCFFFQLLQQASWAPVELLEVILAGTGDYENKPLWQPTIKGYGADEDTMEYLQALFASWAPFNITREARMEYTSLRAREDVVQSFRTLNNEPVFYPVFTSLLTGSYFAGTEKSMLVEMLEFAFKDDGGTESNGTGVSRKFITDLGSGYETYLPYDPSKPKGAESARLESHMESQVIHNLGLPLDSAAGSGLSREDSARRPSFVSQGRMERHNSFDFNSRAVQRQGSGHFVVSSPGGQQDAFATLIGGGELRRTNTGEFTGVGQPKY